MFTELSNIGINEEIQKKLVELNGYDDVVNMACNPDMLRDNLIYLKKIGIKDIKNILIYKTEVVRRTLEDLIKTDIKNHVDEINEDYTIIDEYL